MSIRLIAQVPAEISTQWLVVCHHKDEDTPPVALTGTPVAEVAARLRGSKDLTGSLGEMVAVHGPTGFHAQSILLAGMGPKAKFGPGPAYDSGVAIARKLSTQPRDRVVVVVPPDLSTVAIRNLVAGLVVGQQGPELRKTEKKRHPIGEVLLTSGDGSELVGAEAMIAVGQIEGEAVNLARLLANTPPAEKTPSALALRAAEIAREAGVEAEVWDLDRARRERFGGLLGVAAGSDQPPAFVVLTYDGTGPSDGEGGAHAPRTPTFALVGKGVTFDSGGLSLKPTASMEDMKADMTGAAVVLAAIQAVARLKLKVRVVGYLALTENMTGGAALKLGDVLTMRNGTTVEVLNTDAEGRLILADALAYAAESKPDRIIDLATLTGACVVALGTRMAGLFSNSDELRTMIETASRNTGERVWALPLDDDFKDLLESQVADLKNVGGRWAGAITAAKFLEHFTAGIPWAHLDIAGPSWASDESKIRDAGATGCFVRTIIELLGRP
jgi:leucyl aminopeptidase